MSVLKRWFRGRMAWLAAVLLVGPALSLPATLFVPLSVRQLTEASQLVVRGTVLGKTCQRDAAGRIYTRVDLKVAEVWKGRLGEAHLTVVQGGGVLGDRKVEVGGQVDYQIGEEVVAFLIMNERGEAVTLGLAQGKFHVWTDPAGRKRARNLFHGNGGAVDAGARQQRVTASDELFTVDELKRQVQGGKR